MGDEAPLGADLAAGPEAVQPLLAVTRGGKTESLHFGCIAVCDASGRLRASVGDPGLVTFLRSSAKPLQALPFLESGAAQAFAATDRDLALACASHTGTEAHIEAVAEFQRRVGVSEADLRCGAHSPLDREAAAALLRDRRQPTALHHNCSGKHTAMLATAKHLGLPLEAYLEPGHSVQQRILQAVAEMTGLAAAEIALGVDGCSAPIFALPLRAAAGAYARLADPAGLATERRRSLERIHAAMTEAPALVSGPGRFDTLIMQATDGRVLAKSGAEGYLGFAVRRQDGDGLGVALKLIDGDVKSRAKPLVGLEILRQLEAVDAAAASRIEAQLGAQVKSHRGASVGRLESHIELIWVDV